MGRQFNWENDLWARGRTDRWYTNGMRFTWTYALRPSGAEGPSPVPITEAIRDTAIRTLGNIPDRTEGAVSYALGQNLYTPRHIANPDRQPQDRPYAAFLYFGTTISAFSTTAGTFHATDLKLGIAGPMALGDETQSTVHRWTGSNAPEGWKYQVKARPGIQASHLRLYRVGNEALPDWLGAQVGWGGATGSLRTYGMLQGTIMIGAVGSSNAPLTVSNEGDFVIQDFRNVNVYRHVLVFASTTVSGVAYNYFLTGSTPYGRSEITHMPWVAAVQVGISVPLQEYCRWLPRLIYTQTSRSAEFKSRGLDRREAVQRWGSISLNWDLN